MKRVITSEWRGGYGYAPETHLYYVVVLSRLREVQMRLQLSDVCGEGRVVAGASRYEFGINRLRCNAASMMWTHIGYYI